MHTGAIRKMQALLAMQDGNPIGKVLVKVKKEIVKKTVNTVCVGIWVKVSQVKPQDHLGLSPGGGSPYTRYTTPDHRPIITNYPQ